MSINRELVKRRYYEERSLDLATSGAGRHYMRSKGQRGGKYVVVVVK